MKLKKNFRQIDDDFKFTGHRGGGGGDEEYKNIERYATISFLAAHYMTGLVAPKSLPYGSRFFGLNLQSGS